MSRHLVNELINVLKIDCYACELCALRIAHSSVAYYLTVLPVAAYIE